MKYSKGPDQTIYLHWQICILTVCIYPEDTFSYVVAFIFRFNKEVFEVNINFDTANVLREATMSDYFVSLWKRI